MLVSISEVFAEVCKESWVSMFALSLSKEKEKHGKEDFLSVKSLDDLEVASWSQFTLSWLLIDGH